MTCERLQRAILRVINRTDIVSRASSLSLLGLCCLLLVGCGPRPSPPPADSLVIRVNVFCTTCDDFFRCESPATDDGFVLYRLRAKSFWAQIATIWDYLIAQIRPKTSDRRPLTIYEQRLGIKRVLHAEGKAEVDLVAASIRLPEARIDMRQGVWLDAAGQPQGQCASLPRREGYAFVRELLGRALPSGAGS